MPKPQLHCKLKFTDAQSGEFDVVFDFAGLDNPPAPIESRADLRPRFDVFTARTTSGTQDRRGEVRSAARVARNVPEFARSVRDVKTFGSELYRELFRDDLRGALTAAQALGEHDSTGDGIRLCFECGGSQKLSVVPWEALCEPGPPAVFLGDSPQTNIVRTVQGAPTQTRVPRPDVIRVLTVVATPDDVINADEEIIAIGQRVRERLRSERRLQNAPLDSQFAWLEPLRDATSNKLSEALGDLKPHILHYIGHGSFDGRMGYLHLHDERDPHAVHKVSAEDFISVTKPHAPSLILLNACEGAASAGSMFTGVAESLLRAKITRFVVAMQYPITNDAAIEFAQGFYTALVAGDPVDVAVSMGRNAILTRQDERLRVEFITPVLYMGGHDARLFEEPQAMADEAPPQADDVAPATAAQAVGFRGGPVESAPRANASLIWAVAAVLIVAILAATFLLLQRGDDNTAGTAPDPGTGTPQPVVDPAPPDPPIVSPAPDIAGEWAKTQAVVGGLIELGHWEAAGEVLEKFRAKYPQLNQPNPDPAADEVHNELTVSEDTLQLRAAADSAFAAADWQTAANNYQRLLDARSSGNYPPELSGVFDGVAGARDEALANIAPPPPEPQPPPSQTVGLGDDTAPLRRPMAIDFATDSARLSPAAERALARDAAFAAAHPQLQVEVIGRADRRGSTRYNDDLGLRRARAVADFLLANGVDASRLTTRSVGEAWAVAAAGDAPGMTRDRRTLVQMFPRDARRVRFGFDSAEVVAVDRQTIARLVEWLSDNDVTVLITGHADRRGSDAYNHALGLRRARAVHAQVAAALPALRARVASAGETQPVALAPGDAADYARDRRVEFALVPD